MTAAIAVTVANPTCLADLNEVRYHYAEDLALALWEAQRFRDLDTIVTVRSQIVDKNNPESGNWYQSVMDSDFKVVDPHPVAGGITRFAEATRQAGERRPGTAPRYFVPNNSPVLRVLSHIEERIGHWAHAPRKNGHDSLYFAICSQHDEHRWETAPCAHCAKLVRNRRISAYAVSFPDNELGRLNMHLSLAGELGSLQNEGEPFTPVRIWRAATGATGATGRQPNPPRATRANVGMDQELPTLVDLQRYAQELPFMLDPLVNRYLDQPLLNTPLMPPAFDVG